MLRFDRKQQNSVKQLSFNKNKLIKREKMFLKEMNKPNSLFVDDVILYIKILKNPINKLVELII